MANVKRYAVTFEREADGRRWVATLEGAPVTTSVYGRTIQQARRRVRQALVVALGEAAGRAELVDDVRIPAAAKRALGELAEARAAETEARAHARGAAERAVTMLTRAGFSRRDVAELTGYSFQRVQQIAEGRG